MKKEIIDKYKEAIQKVIDRDPLHTSDWAINEEEYGVGIKIPKINQDGFDIEIDCNERGIIVFSEYGAHQHFDSHSFKKT